MDENLLAFFKKLAKIKNEIKAFQTGKVDTLFAGEKCVAFKRYQDDECYAVIANYDENGAYFKCKEENVLLSLNAKYENGEIKVSKDGFALVKIS